MSDPSHSLPPRWITRFLRWFCHPDLIEDVEGDLAELYTERLEISQRKARRRYLLDVLLLLRPGIVKSIKLNPIKSQNLMFKNYLKVTLRNSLRYKGYTALNIAGLVVGMVCSLLIALWVSDEVKMDQFHANGDHIYRVWRNMHESSGSVVTTSSVPKPLGDLISTEYPEVESITYYSWPMDLFFQLGDQRSKEEGRFVSANFFETFSFTMLQGDKTALKDQSSIMISRTTAEKFFGSNWKESAMGSTMRVHDQQDAIVAGIFENPGSNSTLTFDWLMPAQTFFAVNSWVDNWGNGSFSLFFTTSSDEKAATVNERITNEIMDHAGDNDNAGHELLFVQKFREQYLHSNFENGVVSGGRIDQVKLMIVVAIFLMVIAAINFMSLATARAGRRAKEIGVRKVMGAKKGSLRTQFYTEAFLFTLFATLMSVLIVWLILPAFNDLVGKSLSLDFTQLEIWQLILTVMIGMTLLSGSYPALIMPALNILHSLRGTVSKPAGSALFRRSLLVIQFAITMLLIVGTLVIRDQLHYVLNKDLGMNRENVLMVGLGRDLSQRFDTYKSELAKIPEIRQITGASGNPLDYGRSTSSATWEGKNPDDQYEIKVITVHDDFMGTMEMEIKTGRNFSPELNDSLSYIINEVAAEVMGFDDPIGKKLSIWGIQGNIVGVVKNFHMRDLHTPIAPLIMRYTPEGARVALIRVDDKPGETLAAVQEINRTLDPNEEFEYEWMDESYAQNYESDFIVSKLTNIFSSISIFISCLGLLGLVSYSTEQRSKEIGIRKVHGAGVIPLVLMLSKDYSRLIIISFILATPIAYYYCQDWLESFEYRTSLQVTSFLLAGILTFLIGALTVSFKSYQAASSNPVRTLRAE